LLDLVVLPAADVSSNGLGDPFHGLSPDFSPIRE
jgi:hypothetical protein